MKAYVEIRSQHSRGSVANRFGGPDTYVAVQVVPEGAERLRVLRRDLAERRGIRIEYCGVGYREHTGPRSALGRALAEARGLADRINSAD